MYFQSLRTSACDAGMKSLLLDRWRARRRTRAPRGLLRREIERREVAALHRRRRAMPAAREDRRREIDVEREVVVRRRRACSAAMPRIAHDERHADAFLVRIPLVGQAVLGVEVAVVGREDDERVVEHALLLQLREHAPAGRVHLGREPVVVLHYLLIFLRRVEAPVPAHAALVLLIGDERRQLAEVLVGCRLRHGDRHVLDRAPCSPAAAGYCFGLPSSACVAKKASVRQNGLSGGTRAQEFQRVVLVLLRDVDRRAVRLLHPMRAGVGAAEVEVAPRGTCRCATCRRARRSSHSPAAGRDTSPPTAS